MMHDAATTAADSLLFGLTCCLSGIPTTSETVIALLTVLGEIFYFWISAFSSLSPVAAPTAPSAALI